LAKRECFPDENSFFAAAFCYPAGLINLETMESPAPGILLIADPFLKDPNFMRTVVFLCEHQDEGSFGFVLNKNYEYTLDELVSGLDDLKKIPVYLGGPVQMDTIHFLHQYPEKISGGYEIIDGVFWGGNFETAIELIRSGEIDIGKIRFYIGYSGWGSGQLADELKEKSWLTVPANRRLVFHKKPSEIWKDALRDLGGEYEMMVNFPIDPQLN
jgi:putative transcriptional regulator